MKNRSLIKVLRLIFIFPMFLLIMTACNSGEGESELGAVLKVGGSTTVAPAAELAAVAFMEIHENTDVTVDAVGSGAGVEGAGTGAYHVGMASRGIKDSELQQWPNLKATVVGRDTVVVFVNSTLYDAGITELSTEQIRDIYLGEITNWQEVGGPDQGIRAFDKELDFGSREVFGAFFLGDEEAPAPGAVGNLGTAENVITTISQFDNAISYGSLTWQTDDVVGIAVVLEDGTSVEPTIENIASGAYPVVRDLNLITQGDPEGLTLEFVEYLLSPEGQSFVEEAGYVAINPTE